ncbi:hemolysin family protein [Geobacter sp. SVR]|uniref:hemolysin family protein n=1 Tax=Geobacter sp. SVR TaxID=2495594 RepID=UPI00143F04E1|nr:hemolysin family protein [Geobacter sp. SVR]BCS53153.1 transporter [Geobacter sp. SVR]GCF84538.1 transporter [Geobacter sp. SVR]
MDTMLLEMLVICLMVVLNGFFSCSEFAIISVRKSRIAQLQTEGDERARIIDGLQQDPHRLLAIVQIGVTVTGSTASTVGGIIAIEKIRPILLDLPWPVIQHAAEPLAVMSVVVVVSYFSLIIGELVPKAIGLQYADTIALWVAKPIDSLARVGSIGVSLLTASSKAVMQLIGVKDDRSTFITREEVQHIVAEGHESGVFSTTEHEYIQNVFEFTHTCVREVMVPRTRIVGLELSASRDEVVRVVLENMYSRYPVYRGTIEDIAGVVHGKDLLGRLVAGEPFDLLAIMRPPVFVPESMMVNDLLKQMQRSRNQMALVVDEYGGLSGLATSEDLIEELLGEIEDEHDAGETGAVQSLPDGQLLVAGYLSVFDLDETIDINPEDDLPYDTVAGLILHELGRFPLRGEAVEWHGYRFICEEVTRTSILKVRIVPVKG